MSLLGFRARWGSSWQGSGLTADLTENTEYDLILPGAGRNGLPGNEFDVTRSQVSNNRDSGFI